MVIAGTLARANGWKYFEGLRKNDIMMVQSNQQVSDMIKRGERVDRDRRRRRLCRRRPQAGHEDLDRCIPSDGTFVIASPSSVVKGSPNPNAAKAFADFMLEPHGAGVVPAANSSIPRAPTWRDRTAIRR